MTEAFKTMHNLQFEVANWPNILREKVPFHRFRVGTCEGLWRQRDEFYEVLAIKNNEPHNGHLIDVLQWFKQSCKRDSFSLKILELWNEGFKRHLIEKHGFREIKEGVMWQNE